LSGGGANRSPALNKEIKQASRLKGRQMKQLGSERGIEKTEKDSRCEDEKRETKLNPGSRSAMQAGG
jgi:hypothetical protein